MKKIFKMAAASMLALILIAAMVNSICFADTGTKGLIAQYKFDGDFKDASGSGFDGTAVGDVTFADDGVAGKCAVFDHGYLNVANSTSLNLGKQFTVSAWVKLDPAAKDQGSCPIIYKFLSDSDNAELTSVTAYGTDRLELFQRSIMSDNSTPLSNVEIEDLSLDEGWTHVALTCDGNTQYIYVNGKLMANQDLDEDIKGGDFTSTGKFFIGKNGDNNTFLGKMDDLRIYNYALSNDEIKSLANTGAKSHKIELQILNCNMTVDGKEMPIDSTNNEIFPYIDNGRTLVPIRAIVENMGGVVGWNDADRRIDITLGSTTITMWLDNTNAEVNGKQVTLDVPPKALDGRTRLPLRFVAENLGAKVDWDGNTQKITITY